MHAVDQVGTVPAALSTYLAVQEFKPDLMIRCDKKPTTGELQVTGGHAHLLLATCILSPSTARMLARHPWH